ncbi:HTH_XRE domain containing protein [uncultured Caudovirales phage]|uniref:HTH_XRE domain containing protein n=1 Tax=uncultured Caudovirales phage TaxID=2100421 RepID=A0A6J7WHK7_9CAUD|nr:HTH_XRE domain containing protein [uncultured Caudovirales phage]
MWRKLARMSIQPQTGHIPVYTIGRRLRDAREDAGYSQAAFADATGISRRTIQTYEGTDDPTVIKRPALIAWSWITGVPMFWLETGKAPEDDRGPDGGAFAPVVAGRGFEPLTSGLSVSELGQHRTCPTLPLAS